ncbi:hypothetical protein V1506DRAFT_519764 [Lipomyces tetrasporus]
MNGSSSTPLISERPYARLCSGAYDKVSGELLLQVRDSSLMMRRRLSLTEDPYKLQLTEPVDPSLDFGSRKTSLDQTVCSVRLYEIHVFVEVLLTVSKLPCDQLLDQQPLLPHCSLKTRASRRQSTHFYDAQDYLNSNRPVMMPKYISKCGTSSPLAPRPAPHTKGCVPFVPWFWVFDVVPSALSILMSPSFVAYWAMLVPFLVLMPFTTNVQ